MSLVALSKVIIKETRRIGNIESAKDFKRRKKEYLNTLISKNELLMSEVTELRIKHTFDFSLVEKVLLEEKNIKERRAEAQKPKTYTKPPKNIGHDADKKRQASQKYREKMIYKIEKLEDENELLEFESTLRCK